MGRSLEALHQQASNGSHDGGVHQRFKCRLALAFPPGVHLGQEVASGLNDGAECGRTAGLVAQLSLIEKLVKTTRDHRLQ